MKKLLVMTDERIDKFIEGAEERLQFYRDKGMENYERIWAGEVTGLKNARAAMTEVDTRAGMEALVEWGVEASRDTSLTLGVRDAALNLSIAAAQFSLAHIEGAK